MRYGRWRALGLSIALITLLHPPAWGQSLEKVTLGFSGRGGGQEVITLMQEEGLFTKHGLEVNVVYIEGGSLLAQAMVSGEIPLAVSAAPEFVHSALAGSGLKIIATSVNRMPYAIITAKEITKPEQLKGKKMAVSRFGSGSDFATRKALEYWGLDPVKDVTILQVGNTPSRLAALQGGSVQGAVISPSLRPKAEGMGFTVLGDLTELPIDYPHLAVAATPTLIRNNPEIIRKFLRTYAEGIWMFKTKPEIGKKAMVKQLGPQKPEELNDAYAETGKLLSRSLIPTVKGIQTVLNDLGEKIPKAKATKPEEISDARFATELEKSGFIGNLYK